MTYSAARAAFGTNLTAIVTPFTKDDKIDHEALAQLATDLVNLGNDGLVVNGTTGEAPTVQDDEKTDIVRTVVEAVGDRARVIAGVGSNDTWHTLHLTKNAVAAGAHGLLVVTPYYNKPPQEGIYQHMVAVADASDLPVMVYDSPGRAGVAIAHDTMLRLAQHPRILANKDAKGDIFEASRVIAKTDLAYYSGDDPLNLALLTVGALGVVSVTGHIVADRHRQVVDSVAAGDIAKAMEITAGMIPVTEGLMMRAGGAIMAKAALDLLGRAGGGNVRLPLVPATDAQRDQLRLDLIAGGFAL